MIIRSDASSSMGTGHVMRCLALAEAWRAAGGDAAFFAQSESEDLQQRLRTSGFEVHALNAIHPDALDLRRMQSAIAQRDRPIVVLDGYHFDTAYQRTIRETGCRLLVIDDTAHLPRYHADILLNQNIHAPTLSYECDSDTVRLLGPRYALLRSEFAPYRSWRRDTPERPRHVLVTLGGSDPHNTTVKVVQALRGLAPDLGEVRVVAGPANQHLDKLRAIAATVESVEILTSVRDMPALMAWADLAVSAGGSTCWELAFMGVPMLLTSVATNQTAVVDRLAALGLAWSLGWHESVSSLRIAEALRRLIDDAPTRRGMSQRARECVDGYGAERVVRALAGDRITLRPAHADDARLLWEWANDSKVRAASFSPGSIPWERHLEWFRARLEDRQCALFVACNAGGAPVGQVRFDVDSHEATISISLSAESRGKGLATLLIQHAGDELMRVVPIRIIHAYVKPDNPASVRAFERAGYTVVDTATVSGQSALHLVWPKA